MTGGNESPVSVGAVSFAGKKYDKGLSASAPMAVSYYLGGNFKTFSATIGQADSATPSLFGPAAPAIVSGPPKAETRVAPATRGTTSKNSTPGTKRTPVKRARAAK